MNIRKYASSLQLMFALMILSLAGFSSSSVQAQAKQQVFPSSPTASPPTILPQGTSQVPPNSSAVINQSNSLPESKTQPSTESTAKSPSFITQTAAIFLIAILPYLVILLTAYIKVVVVLSLLRNALGLQQSPPSQVINGLAIILSIYVMFPTGYAMYDAGKGLLAKAPQDIISRESSAFVLEFIDVTKDPLKQFLIRNTSPKHMKGFYQLALKATPDDQKANLQDTDFLIVIPSYITSQLKDAYEIGVLIYLPFFVIDLVVSNILLAMGMMMLSPLTISLPLKLLLLVMLDGWTVLVQGLIMTFK